MKILEEIAFESDFVVSWITITNDIPFNKIDIVYKNIAKNLHCKTGTSLEHIINRWLTKCKMRAFDEMSDIRNQNRVIEENIHFDLKDVREYSPPFATVIENYHRLMNQEDYKTASSAMAWIRGDSNIPFTEKKKFGVKGDITKENAINFLKALSIFVKSVGYSGLVILVDEAEFILNLHNNKLRNIAYDYLREIYDECNRGKFQNSLFVFAGTPQFFNDPRKGVFSFHPLHDRITTVLSSDFKDIRQPIISLEGLTKENLIDISEKIMIMHSEVYRWNAKYKINPILNDIVDIAEENSSLIGGKVNPRTFIKNFVDVLDMVQQNQSSFKNSQSILKLFDKRDGFFERDSVDDDW